MEKLIERTTKRTNGARHSYVSSYNSDFKLFLNSSVEIFAITLQICDWLNKVSNLDLAEFANTNLALRKLKPYTPDFHAKQTMN